MHESSAAEPGTPSPTTMSSNPTSALKLPFYVIFLEEIGKAAIFVVHYSLSLSILQMA